MIYVNALKLCHLDIDSMYKADGCYTRTHIHIWLQRCSKSVETNFDTSSRTLKWWLFVLVEDSYLRSSRKMYYNLVTLLLWNNVTEIYVGEYLQHLITIAITTPPIHVEAPVQWLPGVLVQRFQAFQQTILSEASAIYRWDLPTELAFRRLDCLNFPKGKESEDILSGDHR